jgi:hypothetical protein
MTRLADGKFDTVLRLNETERARDPSLPFRVSG